MYAFLSTPNAELRWRFYEVALLDSASPAAKEFAPQAAKWVTGTDGSGVLRGRMKFCRPTFRAIARVDRGLALEAFGARRGAFHPIAQKLIEKVSGVLTSAAGFVMLDVVLTVDPEGSRDCVKPVCTVLCSRR